MELSHSDLRHLEAAQGWLGLGDHIEANAELDEIAPALRAHPGVLEVRWQVYANVKNWEACRDIAAAVVKIAPERPQGWVHLAYSLRRATANGLHLAKGTMLE